MVVTRIHRGVQFARYPIDAGQHIRREILHEFATPYKLDAIRPQVSKGLITSTSTQALAAPSTPSTRRTRAKEEWATPRLPIQPKEEVATPDLRDAAITPLSRSARRGERSSRRPQPFLLPIPPPNRTQKRRPRRLAARACKRRICSYWTVPSVRRRRKTDSREHLIQRGFKCLPWDRRRDYVLLDDSHHIIGVLLAQDRDSQWEEDIAEATRVLSAVSTDGQNTLTAGVVRNCTHKLGRASEPHDLKDVLVEVMTSDAIKRIAEFQSEQFSQYAPKAFVRCHTLMRDVNSHSPPIPRNFETSVYPSIRFTKGSDASGFIDIDHDHASGMFTALTALGSFEHASMGLLVFPAIRRYVEFPPGTTALLLSSTFRYGTTSILPSESRMCIAQFCTTSVLQTGVDIRTRWSDAIQLLSNSSELQNDRKVYRITA